MKCEAASGGRLPGERTMTGYGCGSRLIHSRTGFAVTGGWKVAAVVDTVNDDLDVYELVDAAGAARVGGPTGALRYGRLSHSGRQLAAFAQVHAGPFLALGAAGDGTSTHLILRDDPTARLLYARFSAAVTRAIPAFSPAFMWAPGWSITQGTRRKLARSISSLSAERDFS